MRHGISIKSKRIAQGRTKHELANGICSADYLDKIEDNTIQPMLETIDQLYKRLDHQEPASRSEKHEQVLHDIQSFLDNIKAEHDQGTLSSQLKKIQHSIAKVNDVNLHLCLYVYHMRYAIYTGDITHALTLSKDLESCKDEFSAKLSFYYHLFTGMALYKNEEFNRSIRTLQTAEALINQTSVEEPELWYYAGLAYCKKGKVLKSISYTEQALQIYAKQMNYKYITKCNLLLGMNYIKAQEYDQAQQQFSGIIHITQDTVDFQIIKSQALHNLGYVYYLQQEYEQALYYLSESEQAKTGKGKITSLYLMAKVLMESNDPQGASNMIKRGLDLSKACDHTKYTYKFYLLDYVLSGIVNTDITYHLEKALVFFEANGEDDERKEILKHLGETYFQLQDYKRSAHYYHKLHQET
ncbi:lipopolysaccharide assembly protein LapB [Thalassobacillus sp. CUG 92003]|uniref:tetratricopeptide repeat protein n=1 Tax=Thalassobacillus sp. CUG 92003 TaxID=2736641 RepID=UPI0015E68EE3|nr:hypothetical protein [Thalassobacillus sp. CUG 92003]